MSGAFSYIGAVIGAVVGVPATIDAAGFAALTYVTLGKVATWGAVGDTSADIPITLLEGRVEHVSGAKDGGEIPFTIRRHAGDAGQTLLATNANNNSDLSFRIVDPSGRTSYFYGRVANIRDTERDPAGYDGFTGVVRVNSTTVRVTA